MIENYINGNLSDAKRQAKRFSHQRIVACLVDGWGYSLGKATSLADYLKGRNTFQAQCDTE